MDQCDCGTNLVQLELKLGDIVQCPNCKARWEKVGTGPLRKKKPLINLWASFLADHKLQPADVEEHWVLELIRLAEELCKRGEPRYSPYADRLKARELVCVAAMDLGIDLPAIKSRKGKTAMGRGLLDAWNIAYKKRHGSIVGTASAKEAKRRDIKTKLNAEGIRPPDMRQFKTFKPRTPLQIEFEELDKAADEEL
jgi:hypothetical protein